MIQSTPVELGNGSDAADEPRVLEDELFHVSRLVTVGELSACFAHEVFNPLMMIKGHLHFLDEVLADADPLRSHLEVIDRASRRIENMAKRMLDFSRKRAAQFEPCDIADAIQEAVQFVQPYAHARTVSIELQLEDGIPKLSLDRWRIVQALVNLMQNATDAMATRSRRVLTISAGSRHGEVEVKVADTGKGIPEANLDRIFTPFFTTKGEDGTGLGLYIARRVVQEHSGRISVQTSEWGTTFSIVLPAK